MRWGASASTSEAVATSLVRPYDGHTLAGTIPAIGQLVGNTIERLPPMPDTAATMRRRLQVQNLYIQTKAMGAPTDQSEM
jgi:hypothetical protein